MLYAEGNVTYTQELYRNYFKTFTESDTTEKQAMAAAVLLTADTLATEWIFKDGQALTAKDVSAFLASKAAVSAGERGYRYMCDWVTQNANKLRPGIEQGDVYGVIEESWVYIINSVFRKAAEDGGFSSTALISYLKQQGLIQTRAKNNTRGKRIGGVNTECIKMRLTDLEDEPDDENTNLDFI